MWTTGSIKQHCPVAMHSLGEWFQSFFCFYSYLGRWSDLTNILFSNGLKPIDIWPHDVSYSWCNEQSSLVMERLSVVKERNQQQAMINKRKLGVYGEIWYIPVYIYLHIIYLFVFIYVVYNWYTYVKYRYHIHHVYCMCLFYSCSYFP